MTLNIVKLIFIVFLLILNGCISQKRAAFDLCRLNHASLVEGVSKILDTEKDTTFTYHAYEKEGHSVFEFRTPKEYKIPMPPQIRGMGREGTCVLTASISPQGVVLDIEIIEMIIFQHREREKEIICAYLGENCFFDKKHYLSIMKKYLLVTMKSNSIPLTQRKSSSLPLHKAYCFIKME